MELTKEKKDELEAQHGDIAVVQSKQRDADGKPRWVIVLKRPSRAQYKQYRARMHNPSQVADAQEILARQCCVYPDPDAFDALLERWPAIPESASEAFSDLLGLAIDADSK